MNIEEIQRAGEIQLDSGNSTGAIKTFELGLSYTEPGSEDFYLFQTLIAEAELNLAKWNAAGERLQKVAESHFGEENPYVFFLWGKAFFENGILTEAKQNFFAAYYLTGLDIFNEFDEKYWKLIESEVS